jgi:hypothetical protein
VTHQPTTASVSPAIPDNYRPTSGSRNSHAKCPHCRHQSANRSLETVTTGSSGTAAIARNPETTIATLMHLRRPTTSAGTTGNSGTQPVIADHHVHVSRETKPAVVDGGYHLHHRLRPPLHYRPIIEAALPSGHWVQPVFLLKLLPGLQGMQHYNHYASNGTTIPTYGWISWCLNLGLRHNLTW